MNQKLSFKQFRGIRFLSEIFKIIATYIHYAQMKDSFYHLNKDSISNIISVDGTTVFRAKYFFEKLGVNVIDDIKAEALIDLDLILAKLTHTKDKNDFSAIKKMCLEFHEKWYPG